MLRISECNKVPQREAETEEDRERDKERKRKTERLGTTNSGNAQSTRTMANGAGNGR